ncbi:MAG: MMPL family transporter, partial [SAR324 cluster bacterium]|nr:MMPL family transporter [SAR324 cluster bacterium]
MKTAIFFPPKQAPRQTGQAPPWPLGLFPGASPGLSPWLEDSAQSLEFEKAARLRDRIKEMGGAFTKIELKRIEEANDAIAADSRELLAKVRQKYPSLHFEITGVSLLQTAFNHAPELDAPVIWPSMFVLLVVLIFVLTRSLAGTVATLGVIILSAAAGVGAIGYYGYNVDPVVTVAPMIILTLAIADSVHILSTVFQQIRAGADKNAALRKSMEINLQPIFLTSLTTAVGFLVMNFSDSPPFHHLRNVTATGVGVAWLLSMTFLPAALSVLPLRVSQVPTAGERFIEALSRIVISNPRKLALGTSILFVFLIASIPKIVINDFPHRYFDETSDFRRGTEFLENELGFFDFDMSILATGPGGISDPEYLEALDRFETWLRTQPNVVHVMSFAQIIKKLNKNMHGDDPEWYRIPEDRALAAQYILLYEMSLPFGLDLND